LFRRSGPNRAVSSAAPSARRRWHWPRSRAAPQGAGKNIKTAADLKGKKAGDWGFGNEFELFAGLTKAKQQGTTWTDSERIRRKSFANSNATCSVTVGLLCVFVTKSTLA
jgi:hypothetical protein